jgi:DDE family transposase
LACGRLPDSGRDLCSQPTLSRLENAPRLRDVIRLTYTLVDAWMDSYPCEPASVTLDIDDTCDVVHGHQQLSLFNAHYDERCFLPIHVYDTEKSRPVAVCPWLIWGRGWPSLVQQLNLPQKPVYKKPRRSRDKVEPTGHRNEHRCGPTDRQ